MLNKPDQESEMDVSRWELWATKFSRCHQQEPTGVASVRGRGNGVETGG